MFFPGKLAVFVYLKRWLKRQKHTLKFVPLPECESVVFNDPGGVGEAGVGEEAEHGEEAEPVAPLAHRHTVGEQDGRQLLQPVGGYSKEDTG